MLVLSRKTGDEILIGDNVRVIISRVSGNRVQIGIHAPESVRIVRGELSQTDPPAAKPQDEEGTRHESLLTAM